MADLPTVNIGRDGTINGRLVPRPLSPDSVTATGATWGHTVAIEYYTAAWFSRLSRLRGVGVPGQADGVDFCGCGCIRVRGPKSGGDEDLAQLGDHVGSRGLGLGWVPGGTFAVGGEVVGVVAGGGVPIAS